MSGAALDRLLALLLAAQLATGLLTLRAGAPATMPLFWAHGLLGGALLVAVTMKLRRSLVPAIHARRWGRLALGLLLALLTSGALLGGLAWVASGRILAIGPWTVLTLHVWFALAVVPVTLVHLLPRRWRLLRVPRPGARRISRRSVLALGGVALLGGLVWSTGNLLDMVQGGIRRFTGSRWLPAGGIPPPTTFYGEGAPPIDPLEWELRVAGRVARPMVLDAARLAAIGEVDREAVLDCTSGWALRTTWRGVPLASVLDAAAAEPTASSVTIRSATGWNVTLGLDEARRALLATGVAGLPLPVANGAPCRLVAPGRRGLDWIKWVTELRVA